jgi:transposase
MLSALVAGERDPKTLAEMARSRMRPKIGLLEEAFAGLRVGSFDDHHRFLLQRMLRRVDQTDADLADLDTEIEAQLAPFADAAARPDEIPGIGPVAAAIIIAEIGVDMSRFTTPGHLASWARFAPGVKSSAGKPTGNGATGHGNRYLARVLGEAAVNVGRTNTFLGARYRRLARHRGKKKAVVAVGRSMLIIVWNHSPIPKHGWPTSAPTTTTPADPPQPRSIRPSAHSKPSATRSPSNRPPEPRPTVPGECC